MALIFPSFTKICIIFNSIQLLMSIYKYIFEHFYLYILAYVAKYILSVNKLLMVFSCPINVRKILKTKMIYKNSVLIFLIFIIIFNFNSYILTFTLCFHKYSNSIIKIIIIYPRVKIFSIFCSKISCNSTLAFFY